ncbi:hypothetical protein [Marinobacterium sediminicola]|uniref:Uncharacterized protein n=1 Tax=Marinobacterium sediminicola TaxID=518898 RepID=A0ABY1S457_9GAMM|nr:hypothetical protein [Marinobacterium sediminicola]ULG70148.1 hypothetical protein LN244_04870 [Marinobacterium sediminicola]SMR78424.1 hypothetical protein SAMN04487964_12244 [Marinobacterium sediminicola]
MSFENMALEGYYTKSGVPEQEAKVISSLFGGNFIHLQAEQRQQGGGKKSKALAAVHVSDGIFAGASLYGDFPLWDQADSLDEVERVVKIVRAAGVCSVCVYAYALDSDITEQSKESYRDFLRIAQSKASTFGGSLKTDEFLSEFSQTIDRLSIASAAHGERKGFFSKIFG